MLCRGPPAGRVEGGAAGGRGRVLGGLFAWGRGDVQQMLPFLSWVLLRWLEARVGCEGIYGDGGALMRGLVVVVVAIRVVGDDDVWCWYVVVERGTGELFGDALLRPLL